MIAMSATVLHQLLPAMSNPDVRGSLFSCSRSDVPCHHFCLRHTKPLQSEVEEWLMTDEAEAEVEEDKEATEEEASLEDRERELMQTGLLDRLLEEAYAQYYDDPDEWDDLANWYSARLNCDEPWQDDAEDQSDDQASSASATEGAASQQQQRDFHPAWRQQSAQQQPGGSSPGRFAAASNSGAAVGAPTTRRGGPRRSSEPSEAADRDQPPGAKRQRDWVELVEEQEREEEMSEADHSHHRGGNADWGGASQMVNELELYETFNDLFFPNPESGRL